MNSKQDEYDFEVVELPQNAKKGFALLELMKPLAAQLARPDTQEIAINKPGRFWVKTFKGWEPHDLPMLTMDYLHALANATIVFNSLNDRSICSVIMPEGQRGQIAMKRAVVAGYFGMCIRKHSPLVKEIEDLEEGGTFDSWRDVSFNLPDEAEIELWTKKRDATRLTPQEAELLRLKRDGNIVEFLVKGVLYKQNFVLAGKVGSGKTTLARSLIGKVPKSERILTIEDVHELLLDDDMNILPLLYGVGEGRATIKEIIESTKRFSPDRVFPAELRGDETWYFLGELNTGVPGTVTTTHANSAIDTPSRIADMVKESPSGRYLDFPVIFQKIYRTVNIFLYVEDRKLTQVFYDPIFARSNKFE